MSYSHTCAHINDGLNKGGVVVGGEEGIHVPNKQTCEDALFLIIVQIICQPCGTGAP